MEKLNDSTYETIHYHLAFITLETSLFANDHADLLKKLPEGYIQKENLPNSVAIVPKAPVPGVPRQKPDKPIINPGFFDMVDLLKVPLLSSSSSLV